MAAVTIENLSKSYGSHKIIPDASFKIDDGEFVVLVGPSGCGKSTLLRMIAGLETITGGEIRIDGRRINEIEPKERDIAMVFQSYALYPHMTVEENMAFSLRLRKTPKDEIAARVSRAAGILGLNEMLERYPRQLSGGQRQRVAMGRAIVRDPKVFLFDEPLSNLDAKLRVQMRTEIRELHQSLGTTTVYVTHDQMEAMTMADKIVVMRAGKVEQIGSPLEIYDQPESLFVASFIGSPSMNFLPVITINGGIEIAGGPRIPVDTRCEAGRDLILGVRPEHLLAPADDETGIAMTVDVVEPTGPELHVHGKIANHPVMMSIRERRKLNPGDMIRVELDPLHCHLFDRQTESALNILRPAA